MEHTLVKYTKQQNGSTDMAQKSGANFQIVYSLHYIIGSFCSYWSFYITKHNSNLIINQNCVLSTSSEGKEFNYITDECGQRAF